MSREGIIVLGASGTLGSQVLAQASSLPNVVFYAYDKTADAKNGISACDLFSEVDIEQVLSTIPFGTCAHWRLLIATGLYDGATVEVTDWARTKNSMTINLISVVHFVCGFVERLRFSGKSGRIVVVSSAAAHVGSHDLGYGIAKAGLSGLVRSMSKKYAREGISIIGIEPGIFDSKMSAQQSEARRQEAIRQTHLGRPLIIDEIVATTRYAIFEAPDALTGTFIKPNGGQVG